MKNRLDSKCSMQHIQLLPSSIPGEDQWSLEAIGSFLIDGQ